MKNPVIMKNRTRGTFSQALAFGALVSLLAALPTPAAVYINSDTTIDQTIDDSVEVQGSPTVDLVPGGSIAQSLTTMSGSTFNVSGGSIVRFVNTWDTSTFNLFSGSVGVDAGAWEQSKINVFGGSILGDLTAAEGTVDVSGGFVAGELTALSDSPVNLSGGTVGQNLIADGGSTVTVSGGSIAGDLECRIAATVHLSGGSIAGDLWLKTPSWINDAVIHVYGFGLSLSGPFADGNGEEYHLLTGTLGDGTPIDNRIYLYGLAQITQVVLHDTAPSNRPPEVLCAEPSAFDCAPPNGMRVTEQVRVTDLDENQTLTLTLREGAQVLDVQTMATPVDGALVTFNDVILLPGAHNLAVEVTDGTDTASCRTTVTVDADTTAPTLIGIPSDVSVPATSADGAIVNYSPATASDTCGAATISCSQASGTVFPIGATTVIVTATDAAGNQATASFTVTVTAPALPGDLDGNGCVNLVDLAILANAVRVRSTDPKYDLNGDGIVNKADMRWLTRHFTNRGGAPCAP
ncbi:MAG: HYR domain-containing protein [Verrucomicrobiales bacterium]|nr:HYR domain-containing protein [Verrucomicrobiales bacterium]